MAGLSAARSATGAVLLVSALAGFVHAQARERVLYVTAFDTASRAPVTGLGPDAFVVREDGVRREILRVSPATSRMPVAVIFDNTMAAERTIADLRRSLHGFVRAIDGLGPIALIGVADRPTIFADYTDLQRPLEDAINRIFAVPTSGARLLDAIVEVSRGLARQEADRAAIVVVTTEHTEFSDVHYTQVLRGLEDSGAALHVVVLLNPQGSLDRDAARNRAAVLDRGPRESGGVRFDVLSSMAYEGRLDELAALLKSQYRVVYARPEALIPPARVEVSAARPGLSVHGAPARGQSR
ncbi:MAG: hypothetical protein AB1635_07715 [Acidobacteriota bacterium]